MFSVRLWKCPLKLMYEQPDTPKFKTRCNAGLRSATIEAEENMWDVGVRSVWLASLGAVFPNFLFHGGSGKISFLKSENGRIHRFHGMFGIFSRILDYLFICLSIPRSLAEPLTMLRNPEWVGNTALDSCKAGFRPLPCFLVVRVSLSSGFVTQFTRTSEDNVTTSYKRHCMETYVCLGE